ncbi:MAG: hypothetical protein CMH54_03395 [Myxococcales bacterium]|nr:hypothetical protein [Myxococcales bacterium]|tara:strand:- start:720 stop:1793 length:1074 start_codon:yes stop_codon:yes gene_type:complete
MTTPTASTRAWRISILGTVLVALILTMVHMGVSGAIVNTASALVMIVLPWALDPREPGPRFTLRLRQDLGLLFLCWVVIFPPFVLGFHGWHQFVTTPAPSPVFSVDRIKQFNPDLALHGWQPLTTRTSKTEEVRVWDGGKNLFVYKPSSSGTAELGLSIDAPSPLEDRLKYYVVKDPKTFLPQPIPKPPIETIALKPGDAYLIDVQGLSSLRLENQGSESIVIQSGLKSWPLKAGESKEVPRDLWWIPLFLIVHILAVALPEEYFFRGFIQKKLTPHLGTIRVPGIRLEFSWAVVVAAGLFALVHLATIPSPTRLSVFFAGILFGILYERTDSLTVPILLHATSNLLLSLCQGIWFG